MVYVLLSETNYNVVFIADLDLNQETNMWHKVRITCLILLENTEHSFWH
jgi:hypothetical protein